jgi:PIN domain nuclease of toxin-antitoxin system
VKLLLDTHTLLWFLGGDDRLSRPARDAIEDLGNVRLYSVAGAWEMAIKVSLGKLRLSTAFDDLIPHQLAANRIALLPVSPEHLSTLVTLPFHHRDPFDRMFVAQAAVEGALLVSADAALDAYGIERLW